MKTSRRSLLIGATALGLSGCIPARPLVTSQAASSPLDPDLLPTPNASYDAWVAAFRTQAQARGISAATLSRAFRGTGFLPGVVERDRNQAEFTRTLEDYLALVASEPKVTAGRAAFARQGAVLRQIEGRYGVPAELVCAIWGVESNFGTRRGDIPVISATSTLAFDGRRGEFFEAQLIAALRILENGDTTPDRLVGSWAGAMGHTQFIPTTFEAYAVDFMGDGRRDIWSENPIDALASAAAYLSRSGWQSGQPWGLEVRIPAGYAGPSGRSTRRSVSAWRAAGVQPVQGGGIPDAGEAALLLPQGAAGPAFLVFRNFNVILRYNNSENYGLGVGYLSGRIAGGPPIAGRFSPDRYGLVMEERLELQSRLNAAGFEAGTPDGVLGRRTEAAITAYQQRNGLPVTGTPSQDLLQRLR